MKTELQLTVAKPCAELWEEMTPEAQGRFCAACSKTVVDFTGLSNGEVLAYLAGAGRGVCGRFSAGQLGRGMELAPGKHVGGSGIERRGSRRWWKWLVAGLLLSAEARGQQRMKPAMVKMAAAEPGGAVVAVDPGRAVVAVSERIVTAIPPPAHLKALELTDSARVKVLQEAIVYPDRYWHDVMGLYELVTVRRESWLQDSLAALGLMKKELTVYPNPVRRGMVATLNWEGMVAGEYEVGLFSSSGALIERRVVEVGGKEQVDIFKIPASLAEGVYFLRVARAGEVRVLSRKLVVL